jgi:hypothetical protein
MPWRFLTDPPVDRRLFAGPSPHALAFSPRFLELKVGNLELAIEDLESSAETPDEYETLRRLSAWRNELAAAAAKLAA